MIDVAGANRQSSAVKLVEWGIAEYGEVRALQEELVKKRLSGGCGDVILIGEHRPVITLGKRTRAEDVELLGRSSMREAIPVVRAGRGGGATYHGPGQIVVYPVVNLRERRLGVKRFVWGGLECIRQVLGQYRIKCFSQLDPAGVWVLGADSEVGGGKIAAVGLQVTGGITNHGFALNVNCDLDIFSRFIPCGFPGMNVTSLEAEICGINASITEVRTALSETFLRWLSTV